MIFWNFQAKVERNLVEFWTFVLGTWSLCCEAAQVIPMERSMWTEILTDPWLTVLIWLPGESILEGNSLTPIKLFLL